MEQFTIYCTEEQTRKALELDAPLDKQTRFKKSQYPCEGPKYDGEVIITPTAEQMIGWLESKYSLSFNIWKSCIDGTWKYDNDTENKIYLRGYNYESRKEATLAAIDSALEYLIKSKK